MTYGTTVYSMVRHQMLSNSHGVASLNAPRDAEQPTQSTNHQYEPCTLPHMALSAIRLWQVRTGVGMPEQTLLQALIVDHSPARITTTLAELCRCGEARLQASAYLLTEPVGREKPIAPREVPPPVFVNDDPCFVISPEGYGHTVRAAESGRAGCGQRIRESWISVPAVAPRWRCTNCIQSLHPVVARFGG